MGEFFIGPGGQALRAESRSIFGDVGSPGTEEILFRALCAVGWSVHSHLLELRAVTDRPRSRTWLQVVQLIEKQAIDLYEEYASSDDAGQETVWARDQIITVAKALFRKGRGKDLSDLLQRVAADIVAVSPEQLHQQIDYFHQQAYRAAAECIKKWGGPFAQERWKTCKPLPIRFERRGDLRSFRAVTENSVIILQVGDGDHSLLAFLCLDFQLLHECLSHVFPFRDTRDGNFSESFLYCVERWAYTRFAADGAHSILAHEAYESVRHVGNEIQSRRANVWRSLAREIELAFCDRWISRDRLITLMLELAAIPSYALGNDECELFLGMLKHIWVQGSSWPITKQDSVRSILDNPQPLRLTYSALSGLLKPNV